MISHVEVPTPDGEEDGEEGGGSSVVGKEEEERIVQLYVVESHGLPEEEESVRGNYGKRGEEQG